MRTYLEPETPDNPNEISDAFCREAIKDVRAARQERNITFPRFVKALNRAGFEISLHEYKEAETKPATSDAAIRRGLLPYAYQVLNSARVTGSMQTPETAYAMQVLADARRAAGFEYTDMSVELMQRGVPITPAAYRTCEQGITRDVSFDLILVASTVLDVNFLDLLED